MKHTKSILMAAVAALSITAASAQTIREGIVINVAGSTAMRSISMDALHKYAIAPAQGYRRVAADNTNPASQGIALYIKDTRNGNIITRDAINVRLIGSEGGILTTAGTANANRQTFLSVTNNWNTNSLSNVTSANCTVPGFAAVTFADQSQARSAYNNALGARVPDVTSLGAGTELAALNFAFFANTNFPANNITSQVAKALFERGDVPLSMFTGNTNHARIGVWLTGRDFDSGTRAVTLLEVGYGINTPVKQYVVGSNNVVGLSPATTLLGTQVALGNGGYASGSTLRSAVMNNSLKFPTKYPGGNYLIGYAGVPDVVAVKAKALSFNGVAPYCPQADLGSAPTAQGFSTTVNGLENGSYSYWSIAYLYSNPTKVTTTQAKAAVTALVNNIGPTIRASTNAQLKNGNTNLSNLKVQRANGVAATIFAK